MDKSLQESFLNIIRMGIGHQMFNPSSDFDWKAIKSLSTRQGLTGIVIDGVEHLPEKVRPSKSVLLEWIGNVIQSYEYRYNQCKRSIAELAGFYNSHGFRMMVLKGYACALDWPRPEHRPCGDIDIWLFGKQQEVDDILTKEKQIKIDKSHHHHTVFNWDEFTVENHYDFVNVYANRSSTELEKIFKELGRDDSYFVEVYGEKVYLPSPNLHALFLIKHMASHFAAAEITLRQVLDWAFFVEKHHKDVDWDWLLSLLRKFHMMDFFNIINAICVENLGFQTEIFPTVQFLPDLKEMVLDDILDPTYSAAEPPKLIPRLIYKYRRWHGNAWKHNLCYSESRWNSFWTGVWAKCLKPKSF